MNSEASSASGLIVRLEQMRFSRWHRNLAVLASVGVLLDAADFALFGAALPAIAQEFALDHGQAGLLATVGLVGAFLGALFWGTVCDYIGRRTAFATTVGIFAVFTGLVAAAWSVVSLGAFRFVANFGLGGEIPVALTITSEFMPGRMRGKVASTVLAAFPLRLALAAGLGLVILPRYGWRALFAVGVLPAAVLLFVRRAMPESVRYLISRGRVQEAARTVEFIEAQAGVAANAEPVTAPGALQPDVGVSPGVTVTQLLTPGRRRRTILAWVVSFCYLWSSNGILFMLPTILTQRGLPLGQALTFQLIQGLAGFFGYSACGFLIDRFGRRPVLFLYFFVGAGFHLWFAEASGVWSYVAIALVGVVNPGVFGALGVYVGELYPTHLRATGIGWFFGIGRIGSFLAPAVIGFMLLNGAGRYVLHTFALTFLMAAFAVLAIGIETKGLALEQITADAH